MLPRGGIEITHEDDLGRVRREILAFLFSTGQADLGSLYLYVGKGLRDTTALAIAQVLGMLVREKVIDVDERLSGRNGRGPLVGMVHLAGDESERGDVHLFV